MFCWKTAKSRLRSLIDTYNHPRLLDRGIRIQQSRAESAILELSRDSANEIGIRGMERRWRHRGHYIG